MKCMIRQHNVNKKHNGSAGKEDWCHQFDLISEPRKKYFFTTLFAAASEVRTTTVKKKKIKIAANMQTIIFISILGKNVPLILCFISIPYDFL